MSFARIAATVAVALVLWGGSASAAGPIRAFQVGLWSGGAYTDDRTGDFTHCSAGVAYDSGINMFILVTGGYRWWLGFINPQWAFTPNVKMPVTLRLDGGPRLAVVGTVPSRLIVLVPLPDDPQLIDRLGRSSELNLIAEGRSFFFKLNGTPAVTAELKNCVRRSLALQAPAPAAPSTTAASAAISTAAAPGASPNAGPASETLPAPPPTRAEPATPPSPVTPASETPPMQAAAPPAADAAMPSAHPASVAPPAPAAPASSPAVSASPAPQTPPPPAAAPSIGDSAALDTSKPPAVAAAPVSSLPPQTTGALPTVTATAIEEVRLAQDFFTTAQLPNARLAVTNKPPALAGFTAVWRSDNAAGAVKIIAPGSDVSGVGIASDLIAVDPRMCKGDFASQRSSANIDNNVVLSAVLSCAEGNEQRTAQYFIAPRRKGGFVVFAVVGSSAVDASSRFDRQRIDLLTKAAARAAGNDG
jgi:hypothetical protein